MMKSIVWACPKCLQIFWGRPHWDTSTTTEYVCNRCFYRLLAIGRSDPLRTLPVGSAD